MLLFTVYLLLYNAKDTKWIQVSKDVFAVWMIYVY